MSKLVVDQIQKSGGVALTLPLADGTNGQLLKTDGSGNLSFTAPPTVVTPGVSFVSRQTGAANFAGSNSLSFDNVFTEGATAPTVYKIQMQNLHPVYNGNTTFDLQFRARKGGSTITSDGWTSCYDYVWQVWDDNQGRNVDTQGTANSFAPFARTTSYHSQPNSSSYYSTDNPTFPFGISGVLFVYITPGGELTWHGQGSFTGGEYHPNFGWSYVSSGRWESGGRVRAMPGASSSYSSLLASNVNPDGFTLFWNNSGTFAQYGSEVKVYRMANS